MSLGYTQVTQDVENQLHDTTIVTDDSMCSICKETLVGTERYTTCCSHTFHYNCVHRHMLTPKASCPLCRGKIKLNTQIDNVKTERSFAHEFFNVDVGNFYIVTGIIYLFIVVPVTIFNISALFVAFAGLIKFKFEHIVMAYFMTSLVFGVIQSLVNSRTRAILDEYYETHQPTERFGKNEITILQIVWTMLYLAMCAFTIDVSNNSNISGVQKMYLDVIIASNICRFFISILKMLIYVFDIYAIYERALNHKNLYTFLTFHS